MHSSTPIAVGGELGSGKTTVSRALAKQLGIRRMATGDLQRALAEELGMTTLGLNLFAEYNDEIDNRIDAVLREIGESSEALVLDSRLAWHFVSSALKIHLIVDPLAAAERVLKRTANSVESYSDIEDALRSIRERHESERKRFIASYGVDINRLRNYDLVIDTTDSEPENVVSEIERFLADRSTGAQDGSKLLVNAKRILPTENIRVLGRPDAMTVNESVAMSGYNHRFPIDVAYSYPHFFVVDGHRRLSAAIRNGVMTIPARLVAENEEPVVGGMPASEYLLNEGSLSLVYDWEDAHDFHFRTHPFAAPLRET